jgi:hypothetical protein
MPRDSGTGARCKPLHRDGGMTGTHVGNIAGDNENARLG